MATKTSGKRVKIQPIQNKAYRHEKARALDDDLSWPSTIRTTSIVLSFILIVSGINPLPSGTLSIQIDSQQIKYKNNRNFCSYELISFF